MALRTDLVRRLTLRAEGGEGGDGSVSLAEQPERRMRQEMMQRLQFGAAGVLTMFLLVGLANIINDRANQTDALTVPAAAPAVEPSGDALKDDPLVSAGVVPDLPVEPEPQAAASAQASPVPAAPAE